MSDVFQLESQYEPKGDQPKAIAQLVEGLKNNEKHQVLVGVTGSGKTFTMANVIQEMQKPTLILCHNKTLAAQLAAEFREFFPNNAVCYFVSYYDYYQPESYLVKSDTYIEKDSSINEEIDKFRHAATVNLLTRKDVIIVATVSCIYGLGDVTDYNDMAIKLEVGQMYRREKLLRQLSDIQFARNDYDFSRSTYRVKGDTVDIYPPYCDHAFRIEFFGDEVDSISEIDVLTGEILDKPQSAHIYPAKHTVTPKERLPEVVKAVREELDEREQFFRDQGRIVEAERIRQRTEYDLEMMQETGYCSGIENYTRYLSGRGAGEPPATLIEYFPDDFLLFVDESHISIPQVGAMWAGNKSRKDNLVDYGFRLPSAYDNRPLHFHEFEALVNQAVYVSATPGKYEVALVPPEHCVEQIIRPTGLLDPEISIRPSDHQIDDLLEEIRLRVEKNERVLVTTLTKKMAEKLTDFLQEASFKVRYLHSEVDTIERVEILRDLRLGVIDIVVGINLLREGLDLPEVSLVAILDADKEGFLRSRDSLIQTIGRAARNSEGTVIMYADKITKSMQGAIDETNRRRGIQEAYNTKHGITPTTIIKAVRDSEFRNKKDMPAVDPQKIPRDEMRKMIEELESEMDLAVSKMEFEKAADLRDRIEDLERAVVGG